MNPTAALREYGLMVLRYETIYKAVLENKMVKGFLRAIPGLDDYSMLGKAWWHTTELDARHQPKYDLVIVDAPATGHAITMLRLPQAILESVPEGPLTQTARRVSDLLHDASQTAMILVTLAEDLPASETSDLYQANERLLHIPLGPLCVNQLWPNDFAGTEGTARIFDLMEQQRCGGGDPVLAPLCARARTARFRQRLNERYLLSLAQAVPLSQVHLPYLFRPRFGAAELEELSQVLEAELRRLQLA